MRTTPGTMAAIMTSSLILGAVFAWNMKPTAAAILTPCVVEQAAASPTAAPMCPPADSSPSAPVVAQLARGVLRLAYYDRQTRSWYDAMDPDRRRPLGTVYGWRRLPE